MKKKLFSLMMALALTFGGMVYAQVSLPYNEGFENGMGSWTMSNCNSSTGVSTSTSYVHSGSTAFTFHWTTTPPQYLISPEVAGATEGLNVEFYYKAGSTGSYSETFQVGYSTSTNAVSAFTFGEEITAPAAADWATYTNTFPAGTKYVAIKCTSYDALYLCIDDFAFTANGGGGDDPEPEYEAGLHTLANYGVGENAQELIDRLYIDRPNSAWMEPYHFQLYNDGESNLEVTLIDFLHNNGYFSMVEDTEYPFAVPNTGLEGAVDLYINTNVEWTATEVINSLLAVNTNERSTHLFEIVAAPYMPYCPDVWEKAYNIGRIDGDTEWSMYTSQMWAQANPNVPYDLHDNYTLPFPEIPEGYDAVMKFTVDHDVLLNARVSEGENGKVALYRSDFAGEGGPMATNYYDARPFINIPAGAQPPYEATIGEGTSTTGLVPMYYLYDNSLSTQLFLADELLAAGANTAPMTSVSWYTQSTYGYNVQNVSIWMANTNDFTVSSTSPMGSSMTLVYQGNFQQVAGWNEFVFNQNSFAWDGSSNVLVMVQMNNGDWGSSIQWYYHNPGFLASSYTYRDNTAYSAASATYSMTTSSTTRANTKFKSDGGRYVANARYMEGRGISAVTPTISHTSAIAEYTPNRGNATIILTTDDVWGDGTGYQMLLDADATAYGTVIPTTGGLTTSGDASAATYAQFEYKIPTNADGSLYTSNMVLNTSVSLQIPAGTYDWCITNPTPGDRMWIASEYGSIGGRADDYVFEEGMIYEFHVYYDGGYDATDLTVTEDPNNPSTPDDPDQPVNPTPDSFSAGPVIENLNVLAGTYYLVASSTDQDFEVTIGVDELPCPIAPVTNIYPADNASGIPSTNLTLHWTLDPYCNEYRLIFGSTYYPEDYPEHPSTYIGEWTSNLAESFNISSVAELWDNTNYFWRIEQRSNPGTEYECVTSGPVFGFTTEFDIPQNLQVNGTGDIEIFQGEQDVTLTWNRIYDRSYRRYRIYWDGELYHETTDNDINETSYTIPNSEFAYNMVPHHPYEFNVTAVYDEGESPMSNTVSVSVSGYGTISGTVYEQDGTTPIPGVTVTVTGTNEFGGAETYSFVTNENGYYEDTIHVGTYNTATAVMAGYQDAETTHTLPFDIVYHQTTDHVDFIMDEVFYAPAHVCAEPVVVGGDTLVRIWWDFNFFTTLMEDFEDWANTPFAWQNDATYPWTVVPEGQNGSFCMKSGNAGVHSSTSTMEVTVDIPQDGTFSFDFWSRGESTTDSYDWDVSRFFLDGVQQFQYGQHTGWESFSTPITAGTHTFRWVYKKDGSVHPSAGDYFLVDNIVFVGGEDRTADRSLHHFRIYRTDCYNDGPYNSENTDLLASAWMPDFSYYDVSWPYAEVGVYKFGVSAVYDGNRDDVVEYPELDRESEITWSNLCGPCIDKDMETRVTVNVVLNSADSPEGTTVYFTNLNEGEQLNHPIDPITLDESGFYAFETFRKGDYLVTVYLPGYEVLQVVESIWEPRDLRYVLIEIIYGVKNLYVSRTGWAMWEPLTPDDYPNPLDSLNPGGPSGPVGPGGELTVHDGTATNSYIPVYGLWMDDFTRSEMVYPAAELSAMNGQNINSMKFYISQPASNGWPGNNFQVYVKEVNNTTVSSYTDPSSATVVYTGAINGSGSEMTINFNTPYHYNGGNLLVGFYQTATTSWASCYFYGENINGASASGYNSSSAASASFNQRNFLPKTTFNYGNGAKSGDERHLEGYKIMCTSIDDQQIYNHNTPFDQPFCQLSTVDPWSGHDMLIEGEYYKVKVAAIYSTGISAWSEAVVWQYEPCDHWGPVDEVVGTTNTQGNHIEWVFEHGHNQWDDPNGGGSQGGEASSFSLNLDGGMPADWTNIDADGDGNVWVSSMNPGIYHNASVDLTGTGHNGSDAYVISGSYANQTLEALTPDNYFVSPEVTLGGTFSFWACAQDANYAAEHFGVAVSTTGNTSASDFTTIQEWTLTAKSGGTVMSAGRSGNNRAQGSWYQFSADLTAYQGQTGYVAIRHFNCTDQFILNVDDIEMNAGAKGGELGVVLPYQMVGGNLEFNLNSIMNYNERVFFLYNLYEDSRFDVINAETAGRFIISVDDAYTDLDLEEAFNDFRAQVANQFAMMDKVQAAQTAAMMKEDLPRDFMQSLFTYDYVRSRENDQCALATPVCSDSTYFFPAPVGGQTAESGPDYDCLYTQPRPVWYYFRIGAPGSLVIYMHSNPQIDIDFCCWGPFDDPVTPCPNGLTEDKVVDCSYSTSWNETCDIPSTAQTGEYYIMVITNYNGGATNITFSQTGGDGQTDCGIVPVEPTDVDIIGFLITQDGEYLDIVGPDVRDYTDLGEYGEHEYCVRPIYPGPAILPDTNYYFSMGCPVCYHVDGGDEPVDPQVECEPGDPIYAEAVPADDQIHIWWGEAPVPPTPVGDPFFDDFESGDVSNWLLVDGDNDGDTWQIATPVDYGIGYPHSGEYCASSWSWNNYSMDPDNWMISPEVVGASNVNYFVATNTGYPDHYAVMASSTGTNLSDFTMVFEEDVPVGKGLNEGTRSTLTAGNRDLSVWTERTIELPAGTKYVAFRHYNSYDMNYLFVDDVTINVGRSNRSEIVSYNIYRSTDNVDYVLIANVPVNEDNFYEYFDAPGDGTFYYQVRALYSDGCESEPAVSGVEHTQNYVVIDLLGVDDLASHVNLFPNPTKNNITVQAQGMRRITVVSVLGQVVFDTELNADEYTMNMGQFNAGMYLVRVYTENGMAVKRVTVMQ